MNKNGTFTSQLKKYFFPYGYQSIICWILVGISVLFLIIGSLNITTATTYFWDFPQVYSAYLASGFFLMCIGLAMMVFSINRYGLIGLNMRLNDMNKILNEINEKIRNQ